MTDKLNEMWAALEAHKPAPSYAEAWAQMLTERTHKAASDAASAANVARKAAWARGGAMAAYRNLNDAVLVGLRKDEKAASGAADAARAAAWAVRAAQRAINAIRARGET